MVLFSVERLKGSDLSLNEGMLKYYGKSILNGECGLYSALDYLMETLFNYAIVRSFIGLNLEFYVKLSCFIDRD